MREKTAKLVLENVKHSYSKIATEFSITRQQPWKDFDFFVPYLKEGHSIMDIGCANGRMTDYLSKKLAPNSFHYLGVDNNESFIKLAKSEHPNNNFIVGDHLNLPADSKSFNRIISIGTFHHVPSKILQLEALFEMKRVLKPEGIIIMTVWNLWQIKYWKYHLRAWIKFLFTLGDFSFNDLFIPWYSNDRKLIANRFYHAFLKSELKSLFRKSGLNILDCYYSQKGEKTTKLNGYNLIIIAQK